MTEDLPIAGPVRLVLHLSSTRSETDVFVKLLDQAPSDPSALAEGVNPQAEVVTRGWLKASRRALDQEHSSPDAPLPAHAAEEPLVIGEVVRLDIGLEPTAYLLKAGHRIRVDVVNGDSMLTEALWTHLYPPDKIGTDTLHFGPGIDSELVLPVLGKGSAA